MTDCLCLQGATHQAAGGGGAKLDQAGADTLLGEMIWSSWIAPTDTPGKHTSTPHHKMISGDTSERLLVALDEVNFHRHGFFGDLTLVPAAESAIGSPLDCSCCAARLTGPNQLLVLPSPKPMMEVILYLK